MHSYNIEINSDDSEFSATILHSREFSPMRFRLIVQTAIIEAYMAKDPTRREQFLFNDLTFGVISDAIDIMIKRHGFIRPEPPPVPTATYAIEAYDLLRSDEGCSLLNGLLKQGGPLPAKVSNRMLEQYGDIYRKWAQENGIDIT
jgi:hypothetical protein